MELNVIWHAKLSSASYMSHKVSSSGTSEAWKAAKDSRVGASSDMVTQVKHL